MTSFFDLIEKRESCRNFASAPVEKEKLEMCVKAARLSPSACNSQPWSFVVVESPDLSPKVAACLQEMGMKQVCLQLPGLRGGRGGKSQALRTGVAEVQKPGLCRHRLRAHHRPPLPCRHRTGPFPPAFWAGSMKQSSRNCWASPLLNGCGWSSRWAMPPPIPCARSSANPWRTWCVTNTGNRARHKQADEAAVRGAGSKTRRGRIYGERP